MRIQRKRKPTDLYPSEYTSQKKGRSFNHGLAFTRQQDGELFIKGIRQSVEAQETVGNAAWLSICFVIFEDCIKYLYPPLPSEDSVSGLKMKGFPENAGQNETAGHDKDKSCVLEERAKGETKETPHFHNFYPQLVMCLQLRNV
ncbi:uncharacterized protein AAEQ78_014327 [Lycaon pictus]